MRGDVGQESRDQLLMGTETRLAGAGAHRAILVP